MAPDPSGFTISFPAPLDLAASLSGLSRGGDDLMDRWDGATMVRTTRIEGRPVAFCATPVPAPATPAPASPTPAPAASTPATPAPPGMTEDLSDPVLLVAVEGSAPTTTSDGIAATVRSMFVQDEVTLQRLISIDPVIADVAGAAPGLRPVLWSDPFSALVRSISAQQVNLAWAAVTRARLASTFGQRHWIGQHWVYSLDPAALCSAQPDQLRALQLSRAKATALIGLAQAAEDGALDITQLQNLGDDEVVERLTRLRGVGRWSADWFLARTLGRPRVVAGDLGVRKAVGAAYLGGRLPSELEVRQVTEHWGPAAGMAQQLLLSTAAASARSPFGASPA